MAYDVFCVSVCVPGMAQQDCLHRVADASMAKAGVPMSRPLPVSVFMRRQLYNSLFDAP